MPTTNKEAVLQKVETIVYAWDAKTVLYFALCNQFNIRITSMSKRHGFGMTSRGEPMRESNGYEITGVITYPKYISVNIALVNDNSGEFGVWSYNLHSVSSGPDKVNIPLLEFVVGDPVGAIAQALYEGQRAALSAGRQYSAVRFWKREGDGAMTAKDREHGYFYESRYPLLGMYTWAELEAADLPNWALPIWDEQFSLLNATDSYDLRSRAKVAPTPTRHVSRWAQKFLGRHVPEADSGGLD